MALLCELFDVLPVIEAVAAREAGALAGRSRPVATVCFHDGYRDNWELATPILERHGISATLYASRRAA